MARLSKQQQCPLRRAQGGEAHIWKSSFLSESRGFLPSSIHFSAPFSARVVLPPQPIHDASSLSWPRQEWLVNSRDRESSSVNTEVFAVITEEETREHRNAAESRNRNRDVTRNRHSSEKSHRTPHANPESTHNRKTQFRDAELKARLNRSFAFRQEHF